jgi:hypothetical protein
MRGTASTPDPPTTQPRINQTTINNISDFFRPRIRRQEPTERHNTNHNTISHQQQYHNISHQHVNYNTNHTSIPDSDPTHPSTNPNNGLTTETS